MTFFEEKGISLVQLLEQIKCENPDMFPHAEFDGYLEVLERSKNTIDVLTHEQMYLLYFKAMSNLFPPCIFKRFKITRSLKDSSNVLLNTIVTCSNKDVLNLYDKESKWYLETALVQFKELHYMEFVKHIIISCFIQPTRQIQSQAQTQVGSVGSIMINVRDTAGARSGLSSSCEKLVDSFGRIKIKDKHDEDDSQTPTNLITSVFGYGTQYEFMDKMSSMLLKMVPGCIKSRSKRKRTLEKY